MNKTLTIVIIAAVIVIAAAFGYMYLGKSKPSSYSSSNSNPADSVSPTTADSAAPAAGTSQGTKLADEPYANFAYEVTPGNLSTTTQLALTGFDVSQQSLTNGDTKITLTATNPEYKTQSFELKPGQKLYFIEKNLGDDKDGQDKFLGDDTAVVVDQDGYVVQ